MPAYNFKKQFATAVERGYKNHTIRPRRKRPTVPGDVLFLYAGMRTSNCRLLKLTTCTDVIPVQVVKGRVILGGKELAFREIRELAYHDGFTSAAEFFEFFEKTYPDGMAEMELVKWA